MHKSESDTTTGDDTSREAQHSGRETVSTLVLRACTCATPDAWLVPPELERRLQPAVPQAQQAASASGTGARVPAQTVATMTLPLMRHPLLHRWTRQDRRQVAAACEMSRGSVPPWPRPRLPLRLLGWTESWAGGRLRQCSAWATCRAVPGCDT